MARHFTKSGFGQCECKWCGHNPRFYVGECPVTDDMRERLKIFAAAHGRKWKAALRDVWMYNTSEDEGRIRALRNIIGPSGLDRITPRMFDGIPEAKTKGGDHDA